MFEEPGGVFPAICSVSRWFRYNRAAFLNRWTAVPYRALASLYQAARGSPGICHFSFLNNFRE